MKYEIKSHPTTYKGVLFRSRLEARWAAFFDLVGWVWQYEPFDLPGWTPDFLVEFPCGHSECGPTHTLLVEIKPYTHLGEFVGHPCMDYPYGFCNTVGKEEVRIPTDASAAFGNTPFVSYWEFGHGSGGGEESIRQWTDWDVEEIWDWWNKAGRLVQWKPSKKGKL